MMLVLSFVYPCNALCPHCPYTNSNIRKEYRDAPYMPEATFKKIADEFGPLWRLSADLGRRRADAASRRRPNCWSTPRRSAARSA